MTQAMRPIKPSSGPVGDNVVAADGICSSCNLSLGLGGAGICLQAPVIDLNAAIPKTEVGSSPSPCCIWSVFHRAVNAEHFVPHLPLLRPPRLGDNVVTEPPSKPAPAGRRRASSSLSDSSVSPARVLSPLRSTSGARFFRSTR